MCDGCGQPLIMEEEKHAEVCTTYYRACFLEHHVDAWGVRGDEASLAPLRDLYESAIYDEQAAGQQGELAAAWKHPRRNKLLQAFGVLCGVGASGSQLRIHHHSMVPRGAYRGLQPAFTAFGARLTIYANPTTARSTFSTLRPRSKAACTACLRRQVSRSLFRVGPYHRSFSSVKGSTSDDDEAKEIAAILTEEEPRYNALPMVDGHDELTPRAKAIGDCVGRWLKDVVIGLKLCPWAATVLNNHGVQIMVYEGKELEGLLHAVMAEAMRLAEIRDQAAQETVLIAVPDAFAGQPFEEFIQFDKIIKDCFDEMKIRGKVQLANFHPEFQFGDSDPGAVDNYTNRSPVPIFHLLREEEVSRAVAGFPGDTKTVWKRNKELMKMMGEDKIKALLDKCREGMPPDVITASADAEFSGIADDSGGDESRGDAIEGDEKKDDTK